MCKCASFVLTKGPKVWWLKLSDSHEDIIREHKLNADGLRGPNIVRVEISPVNGDLSAPLKTWAYKLDQTELPSWYDAALCEKEVRAELKKWKKQKLTGWNVKEAFHPVNPLKLDGPELPQDELLKLLKEWASVRDSVWASVRASVWDSVGASVGDSVGDSVWASVRASVRASVGDSVRASVWDSVRASVGDSVRAYTGGLFPLITKWQHAEKLGPDPWRPLLTLWYAGYVPSFDGRTGRLHRGLEAKIVLEWTP